MYFYHETITKEMIIQRFPAKFIFGDNAKRVGKGGLAKVVRGFPNSIGVATKRAPSMEPGSFFQDDDPFCWALLSRDLSEVGLAASDGYDIHLPLKPIGMGTSELNIRCPRLFNFAMSFFHGLDHRCPWPISR